MPAEQKVTRKLRAIFSADVKGYSILMADDEVATIQTLKKHRNIMSACIEQHEGRVVDAVGDNLLAEFDSAVNAVQCAVEVQKDLKVKNQELPEDKRLEFRIGINIGDVIQDGGRLFGDGVNVAARIEGFADAGGICVSRSTYDQIKNKLKLSYDYLGEHEVKNIKEPVRVYKVHLESDLPEPLADEPLELPDKPSIAVLPFVNMSGDPGQEYFSDGLTEDIITGLSRVPGLLVIARNSTFTYKNKPVKVKQVAEEMGVRYVVEGSVQREGNRVRITVQLIDALTEGHLFSERYDRNPKDLLTLQDEITMKVLTAVQVKLTMGEGARIYEKGTKNLDAYLKVLEARELKAHTQSRERVERSRQLLEEAITLDPEYALAYANLSTVHTALVVIGASESPRESLQRAVQLGKKAVALDDSNSTAHGCLVFPYIWLREFDKAISEGEKAVSLSPNSASAYWALGTAVYAAGRPEEAIPLLQKSLRLSPIPVHNQVLLMLAGSYSQLGQYEEAIATCKRVLQLYGPDHLMAHVHLATTYARMDREKEARVEGSEVLRIDPKFSWERWLKGLPYDQSKKDNLDEVLRRVSLK